MFGRHFGRGVNSGLCANDELWPYSAGQRKSSIGAFLNGRLTNTRGVRLRDSVLALLVLVLWKEGSQVLRPSACISIHASLPIRICSADRAGPAASVNYFTERDGGHLLAT